MGRAVLIVVCVVAAPQLAAAAKEIKVEIETKPAGATVYFNDKEDGLVCKSTPCSATLPIGETTVIVEKAGRKPVFDTVNVPARQKSAMKLNYTLDPASGMVTLKGGPAGTTVTMDDVDQGKVPANVEAPAGEHVFTWYVGKKQIYEKKVTISDGEEIELSAPAKQVATATETKKDPPETEEKSAPEPSGEVSDKGEAPESARTTPLFSLGIAFDVGFRQFQYQNASEDANETEDGNMRAGPAIELYPTTLLGMGFLPNLAIVGRFEQGLNKQEVTFVEGGDEVGAKTSWQSFEVSLRQRWHIGDSANVDVGAGFVRDRYQFEGVVGNLPDADYPAVRIGGGGSLVIGGLNPYVRAESRIVLSGSAAGDLSKRFTNGSEAKPGVHGALGVAFKLGPADVRIEGAITRYSWTFHPDATMDAFTADGATDVIEHVQLTAGYVY